MLKAIAPYFYLFRKTKACGKKMSYFVFFILYKNNCFYWKCNSQTFENNASYICDLIEFKNQQTEKQKYLEQHNQTENLEKTSGHQMWMIWTLSKHLSMTKGKAITMVCMAWKHHWKGYSYQGTVPHMVFTCWLILMKNIKQYYCVA